MIPTYNRRPILEKCLGALENQQRSQLYNYEVVVVDDGSTDGTVEWLAAQAAQLPHVRLLCQEHQGPAVARNVGIKQAVGDIIVFIDSDLVVTSQFLQAHAKALLQAQQCCGYACVFTYGRVINTCNFDHPTAEPYKLTDFSAAYFATTNVAIARCWLDQAGLFDPDFQLYGWEDLELGIRLKQLGLKLIKVPEAIGYHWHPPFALEQLPCLIEQEVQRGQMGVLFYHKHPLWEVRLMIQMTVWHRLLWGSLTLVGHLNETTLAPLLQWLIQRGQPQLALEIARVFLNWYTVQSVYATYAQWRQNNLLDR